MNVDNADTESRLATRIYLALLVVVLLAGLSVYLFGLPALGIIGLLLTVAVFAIMLAFTAGN